MTTQVDNSMPLHEQNLPAWYEMNGDKTLRLFYDLDDQSVVFDLGGYQGQWASDIFAMYCCNVYIFEPIAEFATFINKRFQRNTRIHVYALGASNRNEKRYISVDEDRSSLYKVKTHMDEVDMVDLVEFIESKKFSSIHLMKINIEGSEFELLRHLIDHSMISRIRDIQIQFHEFIPNSERLITELREELQKTHHLTYKYDYIWENWRLNS